MPRQYSNDYNFAKLSRDFERYLLMLLLLEVSPEGVKEWTLEYLDQQSYKLQGWSLRINAYGEKVSVSLVSPERTQELLNQGLMEVD